MTHSSSGGPERRTRIQVFQTDGTYVDEVFSRYRDRFGPKRKGGARPMRHVDGWALCTARRLRLQAVIVPGAG